MTNLSLALLKGASALLVVNNGARIAPNPLRSSECGDASEIEKREMIKMCYVRFI